MRAPWPALTLSGVVIAAWLAQLATGRPLDAADRLGLHVGAPAARLASGLVTSVFVHAGWSHALLNALAGLAFGAPVARRFGVGGAGPAAFFLFYLLCGAAGGLAFLAAPGEGESVLVGASGAIAGLMGAASRMVGPAGGRLAPLASPPVLVMAGAWLGLNLVLAVTGFDLAAGASGVGWQAHLGGYAAGVLGIGPALALVRPRAPRPRTRG